MTKTIYTPRDELVCGKIDALSELLTTPEQVDLLQDIQFDCIRMEKALIRRKEQVKELKGRISHYEQYIGSINLHITKASNEFNKLDKSIEDLDEIRKSQYKLK